MLLGYARVSTDDQDLALQMDALQNAGCERTFTDKVSVAEANRTGLEQAISHLRAGDSLVVWKLDRLGRTVKGLVDLVTQFESRGIQFRSITDGIDTSSGTGRCFFHIMAAMAQMERELIVERRKAGLAAAKARLMRLASCLVQEFVPKRSLRPSVFRSQRCTDGCQQRLRLRLYEKTMTNSSSKWPKDIDEAIHVLNHILPVKQKHAIRALPLSALRSLDSTLGKVIQHELGFLAGNDELIICTLEIDPVLASRTIVREYWDHMQITNRPVLH